MADVFGSVGTDKIPAKFARFNFAVSHNPLHLGISKSASDIILGNKYKFDKFAIVNLIRSENAESGHGGFRTGDVELFVCLHILGDDLVRRSISLCQVSENLETLTLYATDRFHKHYGIADFEDVFIKLVKVFPLTKVVFGAKSTKCYDWTKNRLFSTELLVSTCQQKVLVRSGDEFLAPLIPKFGSDVTHSVSNYRDLIALECEPVMQGIISVNTSIVITQIDENEEFLDPGCRKEDNFPKSNGNRSKPVPLFPEPLLMSEFAHMLNSPSAKSISFDAFTENCLSYTPNQVCLRPIIVPKLSAHMLLTVNHLTFAEELCETESRVGMTKATLIQLGALNGSWVVVSVLHQENFRPDNETETPDQLDRKEEKQVSENGKNTSVDQPEENIPITPIKESSHLAQVFVMDQKQFGIEHTTRRCSTDSGVSFRIDQENKENEMIPDDNALYISPRMWFNLQRHPSRLIQPDTMVLVRLARAELEYCNSILASSKSVSTSCQPPLTTELHLGLIKSPDYPMTSKFDKAIKKYFTETRIVSVGDIVTMSTKEFPEYIQDIGEGVHNRYPYINFEVLKIEPQVEGAVSYLIDALHTTVFQGSPVSSYIPATMDAYLDSKLDPVWGSPSPAALWKYADQIEELVLPFLVPRSHCSRLTPTLLLSGPIGCGKLTVVKSVCRRLNLHCVVANCHDLCADTTASTEAKIKNLMFKGGMCAPCILVMRNVQVLARDRDGTGEDARVAAALKEAFQSLSSTRHDYPVIVIATAPTTKSVLTDLQSGFLHSVEIQVPNEAERVEFLHALCEKTPTANDVDIAYIAKRTAGLVLGDLCALLAHTVRAATARVTRSCSVGSKLSISDEKDICTAGIQVSNVDFENALNRLQAAHADAIGAPKIPSVSWEDVGGLNEVRAQILDTIQLPLQHPELFSAGLRRSGVLLYGPPGTGKTLLAKAVATECSLNFLSVKGPELINMYVGQSEENVREVFVRARSAAPCVIFFDELDSLAPNRGRSGDSGGVMDRVVSQLLAELDGMHKSTDVFVIGATNRPDLLDPALLRPGRFDKLLYLGISRDRASQVKIMQALTRKFTMSPDVMLELVTESCPMTMTGADFYALCSDAMLNAIKRRISQLESGESASSDTSVVVSQQDFLTALQSLVPSVSEQELQHYQVLQAQISREF